MQVHACKVGSWESKFSLVLIFYPVAILSFFDFRFLEADVSNSEKFAYVPFGAGEQIANIFTSSITDY